MLGFLFRRVGSDPYYARYERAFSKLSKDINQLQAKKAKRKHTNSQSTNLIGSIGLVLSVGAFFHAFWRAKHPAGTYDLVEYVFFLAPVFVIPFATYAGIWLIHAVTGWSDRWDGARLEKLQRKLKGLLSELKDSTRYDKTQQLLQKYDPSYRPPEPLVPLPRNGIVVQQAKGSAGQVATTWVSGAGAFLDTVANKFIATDPVVLQGLRDAKAEADGLRASLAAAQQRCWQLAAENREYRQKLGLPMEEEVPVLDAPAVDSGAESVGLIKAMQQQAPSQEAQGDVQHISAHSGSHQSALPAPVQSRTSTRSPSPLPSIDEEEE